MLAVFTGLAVMLLFFISGLFNESLFFLLLLPGVVIGVIAAVLVGWNIRKKSFSHPIALIAILGIWILLYLFTTGIRILTVESMVQLFILFIVLSARGLILKSLRINSGSSS